MVEHTIKLDVEKFKEILIHSWSLLTVEQRMELVEIGVHPGMKN